MQQINVPKQQEKIQLPLNDIVLAKIEILRKIQNQIITIDNKEIICQELEVISSIIQDVHAMEIGNPKHFNQLEFEYNSEKLLYQRYEIEEEISELNQISDNINRNLIILEEKQKDLKNKQDDYENKQIKMEEKNNNLVYNLLGFLASFSIVSAAVSAIGQIHGMLYIMIFILFTLLVLITTLIGLHNFYIVKDKKETVLQDNYFLWKVVAGILILLCLILPVKYVKDNKDKLLNYVDKKIENIIEKKVEKELKN